MSPARASTPKCEDMVLWGTASSRAISPAATPSGSLFTRSRNTSSRVSWARAENARIALVVSICRDYRTFGNVDRFTRRSAIGSGEDEQGKREKLPQTKTQTKRDF